MHTVITCWKLHPSGMALLDARKDITVRHVPTPTPAQFQDAIAGATAVLVGLEPVDEALLARASASATTSWTCLPAHGGASPSA
jgi:phosphoglycerate dehydrogenase-like enzyme